MTPRTYYHGLGHQVIAPASSLIILAIIVALAVTMLTLKRVYG